MPTSPQPASVADVLEYLRDVGFGELLRRPVAEDRAPDWSSGAGPGFIQPAEEDQAGARSSALPSEERAKRLAVVRDEALGCTACRLSKGRQTVVFGSGDPDADLMFIGEGPGAEEDRQGLPFVGRAGELLTRMIEAIALKRDKVYIANVVKCRPPGNRDPEPDEVAACRGYLERQIDLVRPRVIVVLGRIAAHTLLGVDTPIGRLRGHWTTVRGVATMVTFHPAALLRNPAFKRPTWEDLQQVRDRLLQGARGA